MLPIRYWKSLQGIERVIVVAIVLVIAAMLYGAITTKCVKYRPGTCYYKSGESLIPYDCPICEERVAR